jgi:GT2 family glycosyltransferase
VKKGFVSVIIVNYNTKELTAACVQSLFDCVDAGTFEIIVVDNGSVDGSVPHLKNLFPSIIIIESGNNPGFGTANNAGAKIATGEFLLLLNSDTIVKYNILQKFVAFYETHRHLKPGVIGSLLLAEDGALAHSYGSFPFPFTWLAGKEKDKKVTLKEVEKNYFAPTKIVVGAGMFIEKALFGSLGGFDENIFLYEEELELQWRMQKLGCTQFVINERGIVHLEGKSSENWFKRKCSFLSLCYVYKKHMPYPLYLFSRARMALYAVAFFKNPRTSLKEKVEYLKLSIKGK